MASINKVILIGNLGRDPEVRYTAGGDAICNLSIATTDNWRDKSTGEKREATEWHRVSFFGKTAEVCGQYLKKGSQIFVEGSLRTRKWTDKDGVEKYTTEIRGDAMQMLGNRPSGGQGQGGDSDYQPAPNDRSGAPPNKNKPTRGFDDLGDDIPFAPRASRGVLGHVI